MNPPHELVMNMERAVVECYHRMMAVIATCRQPLTQAELASSSTPKLWQDAFRVRPITNHSDSCAVEQLSAAKSACQEEKYNILWVKSENAPYIEQAFPFLKDGFGDLVEVYFLKRASNAFRGSLPGKESRDVWRSSVTRGE
jgi:hypothetical protein